MHVNYIYKESHLIKYLQFIGRALFFNFWSWVSSRTFSCKLRFEVILCVLQNDR